MKQAQNNKQNIQLLLYDNSRYQRIGVVTDNKIIHYHENFMLSRNIKGDIFIGKIVRIEENVKAVFVDYGAEKPGFLSFSSIHPKYFDISRQEYEQIMNELQKEQNFKKSRIFTKYKMSDILQLDQKLIVQVIRNAKTDKGAMLSTFLTIKGRYFKYIPNSISSALLMGDNVDDNQIEKLEIKFHELIKNKGTLSVFNTIRASEKEINQDLNTVLHQWNLIKNTNADVGTNIYQENTFLNMVNKYLTYIDNIIIEGAINLKSIRINPEKYNIDHGFNIFKDYEKQIEAIFSKIVQLSTGGYLIFEDTSIGVTIDVNLGKNHNKNYKNSILETNLVAIDEIFRYIELKNIGGMIFIDFIGTKDEQNINKINEKIEYLIQNSQCKIDYISMNKFGIVQICKQYSSYEFFRKEQCPICINGYIEPLFVIAERFLNEVRYNAEEYDYLEIYISIDLLEYVLNHLCSDLENLKKDLNVEINFRTTEKQRNFYQIITNLDNFNQ